MEPKYLVLNIHYLLSLKRMIEEIYIILNLLILLETMNYVLVQVNVG